MDTTFSPGDQRPEDNLDHEEWQQAQELLDAWVSRYFVKDGTPSARGGFEDNEYGDALYTCRECGAVVVADAWDGPGNLNTHRAWHDKH